MRGVYSVSFGGTTGITVNNADGNFDFFELDAATEKPIEVIAIFIGQTTETGDAAEEIVAWSIRRFSGGTLTSGGEASTTPRPMDPSDGAASFAAETANSAGTVASTSGTEVVLHQDAFNLRTGLQVIFPPEMRPKVDGTAQSAMVIRCESTVADDVTIWGVCYVKEL